MKSLKSISGARPKITRHSVEGLNGFLKRTFTVNYIRLLVAGILLLSAGVVLSQFNGGWGGGRGGRRGDLDISIYRNPRDLPSHSTGTPVWTNKPGFEKDVFTFARIKYGRNPNGWRMGGGWMTDTPDSDLNLSYRLQQMTSMKVDPDARFIQLTDKELCDYPFIYIVEPGGLYFTEDEVKALRNYLLNGGFLMLDDFWGEREWANMENEMKRVLPERSFTELPLDHPLYHCVFSYPSQRAGAKHSVGN